MSVQDIIYITATEFKNCKNDLIVCEKIIETYKKLLNSYDCFTKPDLVLLKFPTTTKSNKHNLTFENNKSHKAKSNYHNNKHYHNSTKHIISYSSSQKRPQIKALNSTEPNAVIKRQLQGLLNIINTNNFSKIFNKLKIYVNEDVLDLITDVILDTACCQVFYISIFYNLLMEVRNYVNDTGKSIIDNQISRYVNDYISDELYLYKSQGTITAPENKYHEFCIVQKHKCLATSRNHVVMEIIKNKHVNDWTLQTYCDNLCYTITNLEYTIVEDSLEVNVDILISMIKDLKQKDKTIRISSNALNNIKTLLNNSQRLKFMVEDIAS